MDKETIETYEQNHKENETERRMYNQSIWRQQYIEGTITKEEWRRRRQRQMREIIEETENE